jgi:site-specific recombinase XerD
MDALHHSPDLRQRAFLGQPSREVVAHDLTMLQARHDAPKTIPATIGTLKAFCARRPPAHQLRVCGDITQTTADDLDRWRDVAHHHGLAPSTINTILNARHRVFAFWQEQGQLTHQPMSRRRHQVFVPQTLPTPMAQADLSHVCQVIDALHDRTLFLLMLRCGLRVGEVSALAWSASAGEARSIRIDHGTGQVDRVVYDAPDVEHALRPWRRLQPADLQDVFPSPLTPGSPLSVRTIQRLMARYLTDAHIAAPYSPHALRQTFATHLLKAGAPLEVGKALMGHRSIRMTLRDTQLYEATKRRQYDQAMAHIEPRSALKGFASTTINRRLYALKHVCDFLIDQQILDVNPVNPSQM